MQIVVAFRNRQRSAHTNYMCRTVAFPPRCTKLNLISLFQFLITTNKNRIKKGLGVAFVKRLQIDVYRLSYWSSIGTIAISIPFTGSVNRLPSLQLRHNKQYFIKFHAYFRASTYRPQFGPAFYRCKRVKTRFGLQYF